MKVAAISDIHGNLPALEAVLEDIHKAEADYIVVAGDIVPGPMPREALERLLNLDIPVRFIQGNGEIDALVSMAGKRNDRVPEAYREMVRWSAQQLYPKYERMLAAWPKTFCIEIDGLGRVLFCHATPRDDNEIFTRLTPEENLLPVFEKLDADLVVCGHTHMQFDRMVGKIRVVNAGSVGMSFGKPAANWLLLGTTIQFRQTSYDLAKAAERIQNTNFPQAEDFTAHYIRRPPSEEMMLEIYSKAKLG